MSERILQRVASKELSNFFTSLHEENGVKIFCNEKLEKIKPLGSAFQINTGDYSGQILVVTQAPNAKRLGQFLDARNEAWSTSLGNRFPKLRKLKRGIMMNCEVVYVR